MIWVWIYLFVSCIIAYILKHQLDIIKIIPAKADLKTRNKFNRRQERLQLYLKLCPVWPYLIVKEVYDEIQERRQS